MAMASSNPSPPIPLSHRTPTRPGEGGPDRKPSGGGAPLPGGGRAMGEGMGARGLGAGIVGAGYIAAFHIEAMAGIPGLEIAAICDPDLERARALAQRWGIPAAVASIAELSGLDIHVAHVLTPPDLHVRVTRQLLE